MRNSSPRLVPRILENIRQPLRSERGKGGFALLLASVLALLPKCPVCCAVYLGFLSSLGVASLPVARWLIPVILALLALNLFLQGIAARIRRRYRALLLSVLGTAGIVLGKLWLDSPTLAWIGVGFVLISVGLNQETSKTI